LRYRDISLKFKGKK